jgi:hypothetical protein
MSGLTRSLAFTALLELDPEGFGKQDMETSGNTITELVTDFEASKEGNIWEYTKGWLAGRQERADARAAEERYAEQAEHDTIASMDPESFPPDYRTPGNVLAAQRQSADSWAWQAEPDPGPTERQMEDWNIHNDHADGLVPEEAEWDSVDSSAYHDQHEREDMEPGE